MQEGETSGILPNDFDEYGKDALGVSQPAEVLRCQLLGPESPYRMECLIVAAIELGEQGICEKIPKGLAKDACMLYSNGDSGLCDSMQGMEKEGCLMLFGQARGDEKACLRMEKYEFRDECLAGLAVAKNNTKGCAMVSDTSLRNDCYTLVSISVGDAKACDSIAEPMPYREYRDFCYLDASWKSQNKSICERIDDAGIRHSCISAISKDVGGCFENPYIRGITDCIIKIAIGEADHDLCGVLDGDMRRECIHEYAVRKSRPNLCDALKAFDDGGPTRNTCLFQIAVAEVDHELCQIMDPDLGRDLCFWYVAAIGEKPIHCGGIMDAGLSDDCILASHSG